MEQPTEVKTADRDSIPKVKNNIKSVAENVKEETFDAAGEIKNKSADRIGGMTKAVHGAADELGQQVPELAAYIHSAADRIDGTAQNLRDRSVEELATSFSTYTRQQPAAAFALSALAGFALTRFLKSSASPN